jgi:CRISPR-associated protein Cas5d
MSEDQNRVQLRVWGDFACFTRPEMKVERVSYDVMTPSSARGVLEAILWKPAIRWHIESIHVLKAICWTSVRRNEVGTVVSTRNVTTAMEKGSGSLGMYVEEERQQRAGLFLRDVDYLIRGRFSMTEKAGLEDAPVKFAEMFRRRAEKGQCFNQPYLGCREFTAHFEWIGTETEPLRPINESRDLGYMLYDMDYSGETPTPRFFRAKLENGRMLVPAFDSEEVRG